MQTFGSKSRALINVLHYLFRNYAYFEIYSPIFRGLKVIRKRGITGNVSWNMSCFSHLDESPVYSMAVRSLELMGFRINFLRCSARFLLQPLSVSSCLYVFVHSMFSSVIKKLLYRVEVRRLAWLLNNITFLFLKKLLGCFCSILWNFGILGTMFYLVYFYCKTLWF